MATGTLKRVKEHLNCPICLDTYTNPKQLQCHHVCCQLCLVKLVDRDEQGQLIVVCPNCRQVTPVPSAGTDDLPAAFQINQLLDIIRQPSIDSDDAAENEGTIVQHCLEHSKMELELYCKDCQVLVCYKCVAKNSKHHEHDYDEVTAAFEKCKEEIVAAMEPVKEVRKDISKKVSWMDEYSKWAIDEQKAIEGDINTSFEELYEALAIRKRALIGELHSLFSRKFENLASKKEEACIIQAQIESYVDKLTKDLNDGSQIEVLKGKDSILKELAEFAASPEVDVSQVAEQSEQVRYVPSADVLKACQNFGVVSTYGVLAESEASYYSENLCDIANVQQEQRVELSNFSPDAISAKKFSYPIRTIKGDMKEPKGIVLDCKGNLVITEGGRDCVSVFDPTTGEKLVTFGEHGSDQGQFKSPYGVAIDGDGNILVADENNHRIQKFSSEGQFLSEVGCKGCGPLQFTYPRGITVSARTGKVYVVDWKDHVQILNPDLTYNGTFGMEGDDRLQFDTPWGIACDSRGNIYVADSGNFRVQKFTQTGHFLTMFGDKGDAMGKLHWLAGIAVDSNDRVYVSEGDNNRISVFDSEGHFLTSFGESSLNYPLGLALDDGGLLYVCDSNNDCVKIF